MAAGSRNGASGPTAPRLCVGTSGWSYPAWRTGFYAGVPRCRWLAHCAERFTSLEVNATFYRLPKPETVAGWRDQTPEGFAFAVKGHRLITHVRRLADVDAPLARFRAALAPLGDRLAAVLWQLPPTLHRDLVLLRDFSSRLTAWPEVRHALEFRHESWFEDAVEAALEEHGLATCISDAPRWPMWDAVTAGLAYVRLHGHTRQYSSAYGRAGLVPWAERVRAWLAQGHDVHVYFDNDAEGAAPADASLLLACVTGRRRRAPDAP